VECLEKNSPGQKINAGALKLPSTGPGEYELERAAFFLDELMNYIQELGDLLDLVDDHSLGLGGAVDELS
jgi:hypothetical protein